MLFGDYLRFGAITKFSPVTEKLVGKANSEISILGICNG
jgi:phosphoribosylformylglycinamidine synthase